MTTQVKHAVISSGDSISATTAIGNTRQVALYSPTLDTCSMYIQGGYDGASAQMVRLTDPRNLGSDWLWGVNTGSKGISINEAVSGFTYVRAEVSAAQTDNRTLTFIVQL